MRLIKIEGGRINVYEPQILTVGATAVVAGEALVLNNGKLVRCGEDALPTFVALASGAAGAEIAVGRVQPDQIYEVTASPDMVVGTKYALTEDGTGVSTSASGGGKAEVVYFDANVAHIRFS